MPSRRRLHDRLVLYLFLATGAVGADDVPRLYIEPIQGLTTIRHPAPVETAIPVGMQIDLCYPLPEVMPSPYLTVRDVDRSRTVTWTGASALHVQDDMAWARCSFDTPGVHEVNIVVEDYDGGLWESRCTFNVVDIALSEIRVGAVTPTVGAFDLHEGATNQETMDYYFGESIAALRRAPGHRTSVGKRINNLGSGQTSAVPRFITSIDRAIDLQFHVSPVDFQPIIEVRPAMHEPYLAASGPRSFNTIGLHRVEVGPTDKPRLIEFETYRVRLTSHISNHDVVPEGEDITFAIATDPPGYEDYVTWISSTKYGTATPVLGARRQFTVRFDDTWGLDNGGDPFQWLGVKADNVIFNQDGKCANMFPATAGIVASDGACNAQIDIFGVTDGFVDIDIPHANVCILRGAPTSHKGNPREVQLDVLIEVGSFVVPKVGDVQIVVESGSGIGSVIAQTSSCDFPADMTLQVAKSYVTPLGTFLGGLEIYEAKGITEFPPYGVTFLQTLGDVPLFDDKGTQVGLFRPLDLTPIGPIEPSEFPGGCPPQ